MDVGYQCYVRLGGQQMLYADGGGDDEEAAFKSLDDAKLFLDCMEKIGFEANMAKQMLDEKGEFYRNTMGSEGLFGNPTRILANFVSGNWESLG